VRFWLLNILFVVLLSVSVRAQQNQYRVTGIEVNGNDVTKNEIITRELTFKVGDTLSLEKLSYNIERSENNIFNTTLFNYVSIIPEFEDNSVAFSIFVFERWYIWPFPLVENADRNFNVWWQNKDFDRLSYGMRLVWNNFRGRNETLVLTGKAGYQERLSLAYGIPYLDREKKFGLKFEAGYSMNKEVNYGSSENKRLFYKEIETPQRRNSYANMRFTWRDKLYTRQHFTLFYDHISVTDTLQELGQPFELLPGNRSKSEFFSFSYDIKFDKRDYINYPLNGLMLHANIMKKGFGIVNDEGLDVLTARMEAHYHQPIGERFTLSNGLYSYLNFLENPPYMLQSGLGYNDFVRGYELYVIDAQDYFLSRNNIKFHLLKPKIKRIDFIPLEQFKTIPLAVYTNAYIDVGYGSELRYQTNNNLANKWLVGYGAGLDFVTYYDLIIRTEYSFNIEGENGFFLHFVKPI
jgi:hypothetical protein